MKGFFRNRNQKKLDKDLENKVLDILKKAPIKTNCFFQLLDMILPLDFAYYEPSRIFDIPFEYDGLINVKVGSPFAYYSYGASCEEVWEKNDKIREKLFKFEYQDEIFAIRLLSLNNFKGGYSAIL